MANTEDRDWTFCSKGRFDPTPLFVTAIQREVACTVVTGNESTERPHVHARPHHVGIPVELDPELEPEAIFHRLTPPLSHLTLVFLGGLLGTLLRYAVVFHHHAPLHAIDTPIVLINAAGALVLGFLGMTLFTRRAELVGTRLFLATGVLGGWTTYSAVIAGSLTLAHHHATAAAAANLGIELVAPVLAAGLGLFLGSLTVEGA